MSLLIETGRLHQRPERIRGKESSAALGIEFGDLLRPEGPLAYDLLVQCVSGELIVRGKLNIRIGCRCARCGGDFSKDISIADFCRNFPLMSKNELINLTPDVREDIVLSLPMVTVCSSGCRGLCERCGVNLNRAKCKCQPEDKTDAWRVLDDLRLAREARDKR